MTLSSSMNLGCPLSLSDHQSGALCGSLHHSSSRLRIYWQYIILLKVGVMVSRSTLVISLVPPPPQGTCVALHSVPKHFGAAWRPSLKISLFQKLPLSVCLCYMKRRQPNYGALQWSRGTKSMVLLNFVLDTRSIVA